MSFLWFHIFICSYAAFLLLLRRITQEVCDLWVQSCKKAGRMFNECFETGPDEMKKGKRKYRIIWIRKFQCMMTKVEIKIFCYFIAFTLRNIKHLLPIFFFVFFSVSFSFSISISFLPFFLLRHNLHTTFRHIRILSEFSVRKFQYFLISFPADCLSTHLRCFWHNFGDFHILDCYLYLNLENLCLKVLLANNIIYAKAYAIWCAREYSEWHL